MSLEHGISVVSCFNVKELTYV